MIYDSYFMIHLLGYTVHCTLKVKVDIFSFNHFLPISFVGFDLFEHFDIFKYQTDNIAPFFKTFFGQIDFNTKEKGKNS